MRRALRAVFLGFGILPVLVLWPVALAFKLTDADAGRETEGRAILMMVGSVIVTVLFWWAVVALVTEVWA